MKFMCIDIPITTFSFKHVVIKMATALTMCLKFNNNNMVIYELTLTRIYYFGFFFRSLIYMGIARNIFRGRGVKLYYHFKICFTHDSLKTIRFCVKKKQ